jgi:hypothetical protein
MSTNYKAPHCATFSHYLSLLGPNILLSTLFSNTLSLWSSLNVRDQALHPHTTGRIMVLYILTFKFLNSRWEGRRLNWMVASVHQFSLFLILSCMQFWSFSVVPRYLNVATCSKDLFPSLCYAFVPSSDYVALTYLVFSGLTSRPTSVLASLTCRFYESFLFNYVKA